MSGLEGDGVKKGPVPGDAYRCGHGHGPSVPEDGPPVHGHAHAHDGHTHVYKGKERSLLLLAIVITSVTMVVEFFGGWWSNSLALMSDAGHMLTHVLALGLSYAAIWVASRESTSDYSFGLFRSETLAALFNAFFLIVISGLILWEAYQKVMDPGEIKVTEMFVVALLGLVVNIVTAGILIRANPEGDLNIKGAFIHMLSDTFSSVGVVIGAVVIHYTGLTIVDPILAVLISVLILVWVFKLARSAIRVLLERAPEHMDVDQVRETIKRKVPEIIDVHDVHIWEIATNMYNLSAHVILDDIRLHEAMPIISKVKALVKDEFNIGHAIIQIECSCVEH